MIRLHRVPALAAALFLQVAPLIRTAEPVAAAVLQPLAILFRWAAGVAALAGSVHAVSGATGLISAQSVDGTEGQTLVYRAQIISDEHGIPESYTATGLPPGLAITALGALRGTVQGIPAQAGSFDARITGWKTRVPGAGEFFYTATVRFEIAAVAPSITTHPESQVVTAGSRVELRVVATGSDLTYQWIHDDIEFEPGTGDTLVLDPVREEHDGTWRVRVSNPGGVRLSDPAVLTVEPGATPPSIIRMSPPRTVHAGEPVRLEVEADGGGGVLTYQWFDSQGDLPGGDAPVLNLPPLAVPAVREFLVRIMANGLGTTSAPVRITVVGPLTVGVPTPGDGGLVLPFAAIPDRTYQLETTDSVPGGWSPSGTPRVAAGAAEVFVVPTTDAARVFRIRLLD